MCQKSNVETGCVELNDSTIQVRKIGLEFIQFLSSIVHLSNKIKINKVKRTWLHLVFSFRNH